MTRILRDSISYGFGRAGSNPADIVPSFCILFAFLANLLPAHFGKAFWPKKR
ncbi:hypothetical protein K458DRAFT_416818 [Lentithecium fluviatile CBS 122367]|uniref:Uncharacterized protein n=1 Tax=Lentithecium fluviatile CBS 122367 TaxID=1168545 RepID=A0A6G1J4Z6_9PLEO|nr:hypothetical protein K458DRAFT_416818 [Lentithecium fluviatile CBS 122367]